MYFIPIGLCGWVTKTKKYILWGNTLFCPKIKLKHKIIWYLKLEKYIYYKILQKLHCIKTQTIVNHL